MLRGLAVLVLLVAACATADVKLGDADTLLRHGDAATARARYVELAGDRQQRVRILAALGAARASAALEDPDGEMQWLERAAADPAVPGVSERAYFALAERLHRDGDTARALNFYYRAASGAERIRDRKLYDQALQAITRIGIAR